MVDIFTNPVFLVWVVMAIWLAYLDVRYMHVYVIPELEHYGINGKILITVAIFSPVESIIKGLLWPIDLLLFKEEFYRYYKDITDV